MPVGAIAFIRPYCCSPCTRRIFAAASSVGLEGWALGSGCRLSSVNASDRHPLVCSPILSYQSPAHTQLSLQHATDAGAVAAPVAAHLAAVWPSIRTRLFSSFPKRSDLIAAVLASCHLPTLSDGSLTVNFHGNLHIDGGLLSVITPPPHASHSVLVCSMPSGQIARLPAFISRPCQADISISPDTFQSWPFSRKETTDLALQPPNADFIQHMVSRDRLLFP